MPKGLGHGGAGRRELFSCCGLTVSPQTQKYSNDKHGHSAYQIKGDEK